MTMMPIMMAMMVMVAKVVMMAMPAPVSAQADGLVGSSSGGSSGAVKRKE